MSSVYPLLKFIQVIRFLQLTMILVADSIRKDMIIKIVKLDAKQKERPRVSNL